MHTDAIVALPPSRNLSTHRICALAELFAMKCAEDKNLVFRALSTEALALVASYDWKGDLSALEATIRHAVVMADGDEIDAGAIRLPSPLSLDSKSAAANKAPEATVRALLGSTVSDVERDLIQTTLKYCGGHRSRAADILGISVRTLRNKLTRYALDDTALPDPCDADKNGRSWEISGREVVHASDHPPPRPPVR